MRMSMNWLKEYVNLDGVTPEVLAEKLTIAGLEVEGIEKMAEGTNLVIGQVLTCENHPDSDHLRHDGQCRRRSAEYRLRRAECPGGTESHRIQGRGCAGRRL